MGREGMLGVAGRRPPLAAGDLCVVGELDKTLRTLPRFTGTSTGVAWDLLAPVLDDAGCSDNC